LRHIFGKARSSKNNPIMNTTRIAAILFVVMSLVLIACGGGGGPATGTTTGDCPTVIGPLTSIRLEAVQEGTSTVVDPTNIFVNEQIRFRMSGIDTGAVGQPRVNLCATGFTLTGAAGGSLATNGAYTAPPTASPDLGTVRVTYSGTTYTSAIRTVVPQAILAGRVILSTGAGAPRIGVQGVNAAGTVIATGITGADGTIRMSIPTAAVKFSLDFSGVDPNATFYVRQFTYNNRSYSTVVIGCVAPLPTLTTGVTTNLLSNVLVFPAAGSNPPPPPDGCQ
jgi:hypothetical protein